MKHYDRDTFTYRRRTKTLLAEAASPLPAGRMAKRHRSSWKISMCAAKEPSSAFPLRSSKTARSPLGRTVLFLSRVEHAK